MAEPSPNEAPSKKIIVDEDWKSQVEAEKEALRKQSQTAEDSNAAGPAQHDPPLPQPTLEFLASTMALQATVALGVAPDPVTGKREVRLNQARHFIDTIEMLYEKTAGNRTAEETALLDHLLHELRLDYVTVAGRLDRR